MAIFPIYEVKLQTSLRCLWHKLCLLIEEGLWIQQGEIMLRAAIAFFVLGLVAILLGANSVGGMTMDVGRTLLFIFLILAVISFVASLVIGKKPTNI